MMLLLPSTETPTEAPAPGNNRSTRNRRRWANGFGMFSTKIQIHLSTSSENGNSKMLTILISTLKEQKMTSSAAQGNQHGGEEDEGGIMRIIAKNNTILKPVVGPVEALLPRLMNMTRAK
jgi:hypothetical protein